MAIEFEILAHFCSKLVNVWSGWREFGVLLVQRESHQVFERVAIRLDLKWILNLGSILLIHVPIMRNVVKARAGGTVARSISGGAWISDLLDFVRQVLCLRETLVMAWGKMCWLRSYFRISLGHIRNLEGLARAETDDLASDLATTVLWLVWVIGVIRGKNITSWCQSVTVWYFDCVLWWLTLFEFYRIMSYFISWRGIADLNLVREHF